MLVLDSGGLSRLAKRDMATGALLLNLRRRGLWPPIVPSVVLVESLTGAQHADVNTNRFLKTCEIRTSISERMARRAGQLRAQARRGSAVDALTVAMAEPGGTVVTSDSEDLNALAAYAADVIIEIV